MNFGVTRWVFLGLLAAAFLLLALCGARGEYAFAIVVAYGFYFLIIGAVYLVLSYVGERRLGGSHLTVHVLSMATPFLALGLWAVGANYWHSRQEKKEQHEQAEQRAIERLLDQAIRSGTGLDSALAEARAHGRDVNMRRFTQGNGIGYSPLHLAAALGDTGVVEYLLSQHLEVDANDFSGETPLCVALQKRSLEIARLLLRHGAQFTRSPECFERVLNSDIVERSLAEFTAMLELGIPKEIWIHVWSNAAQRDRADLLGLLLDHGADVDAKDVSGDTALCTAAQQGSVAAVTMLLRKGATRNLRCHDSGGETALAKAKNNERVYLELGVTTSPFSEIVKLLQPAL